MARELAPAVSTVDCFLDWAPGRLTSVYIPNEPPDGYIVSTSPLSGCSLIMAESEHGMVLFHKAFDEGSAYQHVINGYYYPEGLARDMKSGKGKGYKVLDALTPLTDNSHVYPDGKGTTDLSKPWWRIVKICVYWKYTEGTGWAMHKSTATSYKYNGPYWRKQEQYKTDEEKHAAFHEMVEREHTSERCFFEAERKPDKGECPANKPVTVFIDYDYCTLPAEVKPKSGGACPADRHAYSAHVLDDNYYDDAHAQSYQSYHPDDSYAAMGYHMGYAEQQAKWTKEWDAYAKKHGRAMTMAESHAAMEGPPPKEAHIDYSNELNLDYGGYQQPPQYQVQNYPYFDGYGSSRRQDVMVLPPQSNGYYVMPPDQFAVGGMAPSYSAYQDNALLLVLLMLVLALFGCVCLCASAAIGWFSGRKSVQDRGSKVWSPIAQEVDEV
mmetsp:Transcript_40352/g.66283  ORF Transcript_40352/g.66283 Transcript_40352/m.66283 type:complete len:438 (+) Transcript_40352:30-1343(+)